MVERDRGAMEAARHEQAELATQAYQQEISGLKEQLQTKTQEARELSHMLRAWEAMRAGKDQQIAQLVELSKRFEQDSAEKARSLEKIKQDASSRQAAARGGSSSSTLAQRLFGPDTTSQKGTAASSDPQAAALKRDGPRVLQAKPTVVYSLKGIVPPPPKQY
eukprot:CAMPEP_0118952484 /NCGR_PEP_ID=MMETSP1169-20130426/54927_1 /TAXON_ID=36882 /ORGANISM="Pyramimonas obovata, Strain CCMP722" /LENGTH=162 /DNA_ID=CAMNT_0006899749 /DNA_START=26 /DNA_END=514 /DNA_ORIENTATION=-